MKKIAKKLLALFFSLLLFISNAKLAIAIEDPLIVPNNLFGIHVIDENDLPDAANLVNSGGGDWGYVTIVIRKDERDHNRWQRAFDNMRRLHLIPIVRIATRQVEDGWEKPNVDEIDGWVDFLDSLNWVTKNRYIVIGNEPNHAGEWGGEVAPEEYANYLYEFAHKLKNTTPEFFVLPAGLDASAPNAKDTMSEEKFLQEMLATKSGVFDYLDGWTSHSYPNPAFSGPESAHGKGTVRTFDWEIDYLKQLGVDKPLPIFITETGWVHDMGNGESAIDAEDVAKRILEAYNTAWRDERIVAITPFVLNYQSPPFDRFSWKKPDGHFYDFYYKVRDLPKIKGAPAQDNLADVQAVLVPPIVPSDGKFVGIVYTKNKGQVIWSKDGAVQKDYGRFKLELDPIITRSDIEPGSSTFAILRVDTKN